MRELSTARVPLRGLLFDKDGTLFDFEATWGGWAADVLTALFGARAAEMAGRIGFDMATGRFDPTSPVIAATTAEVADLLLPALPGWERPALVAEMKARAAAAEPVPAVPLAPVMSALRARGMVLGLATNDDETSARAHLAAAGVAGAFDFVAGYDSGWGGKPAAGQVTAFLAATGLAPGQVAMVGDSLHDLRAGRAAGVVTVGVLSGPATEADLAPLADAVLPDITALPGWLDSRG